MKLFKNKVGRPSNRTLKLRKIIISLVMLIVLIAGFSIYLLVNNNNVVTQNKGLILNSEPSIKIRPLTKETEVKKGTIVKYYITLKNLSKKSYYYKVTLHSNKSSGTSECAEFSNINKSFKYPITITDNNTYIKYTIYSNSTCTNVYKTVQSKPINIKKETTTSGKSQTFTAKFEKNGATSIGTKSLTCTTTTGSCTVTAPSITRDGYTIQGWATGRLFPAKYKVGEKITLTKNQTFYAKTYLKSLIQNVGVDLSADNNNRNVKYNTVINFTLKYYNNTNDKYYYIWRTYTEGQEVYKSSCIELKDGAISRPTLKINNNNRYGKITIYKDKNCSTTYKSYNTNTYSAIEYIPSNSINGTNNYHYSTLNNREKIMYSYLYEKKSDMINKNIVYLGVLSNTLGNIKSSEVQNAFKALMYDKPEYHFINLNRPTIYYVNSSKNTTRMSFNGDISSDSLKSQLNKIDNVVNSVVNNAKKKSNNYQKIKYVHDYIKNNMDYKLNTALSINGYTVKTGQCMTYALMFGYALNKLGIRSIYVTGTAGGPHAWNYVYLDNKWYLVDVTWDDSLKSNKYFLLGSSSPLLKDRVTSTDYKFPALSKYNY